MTTQADAIHADAFGRPWSNDHGIVRANDGVQIADMRAALDDTDAGYAALTVEAVNAHAALIAERDALRAALRLAFDWLDLSDPTATFDRIADEFYRDTGFMRPGKSMPLEMCGVVNEQRREVAWAEWITKKRAAMLTQMQSALLASEGK